MTAPVRVLTMQCDESRAPMLADALLAAGAGAVEQRPAPLLDEPCELVVFAGERPLSELHRFAEQWASLKRVSVTVVPAVLGSDWAQAWTQHLSPFAVHEQLRIVPIQPGQVAPRRGDNADTDELYLEAGLAFGYGEHPTTQMIAEWLASTSGGCHALDFGTGSGVLALIALLSGALTATGLDIDEQALVLARRNAELNGFSAACEFLSDPLSVLPRKFDVVVANIDALTLAACAAILSRAITPGGLIALTGLLEEQQGPVLQAFAAHGVSLECKNSREDWVLLVGHKSR